MGFVAGLILGCIPMCVRGIVRGIRNKNDDALYWWTLGLVVIVVSVIELW